MNRPCSGINKAGNPCKSFAVDGSDFCMMHTPERAEEVQAGRVQGGKTGKRTSVKPDVPDLALTSAEDVKLAIGDTVNRCRRGDLDVRIGNLILVGCSTFLAASRAAEDEAMVKAAVQSRKGTTDEH